MKHHLAFGLGIMSLGSFANAGDVYFQDFQGTGPFNYWSPFPITTTPSGERFLGRLANNDLAEFNVTQYTGSYALHTYTVSFDLYAIGSLDGENQVVGPDQFYFGLQNGTNFFKESFSNWEGFNQSYGGPGISGNFAPRTGATSINTLGLNEYFLDTYSGDSVYRNLSFTFQHEGELTLRFGAKGLQNKDDESFGIDNLRVSVDPVPEPASFAALGVGASVLLARRRRKNK